MVGFKTKARAYLTKLGLDTWVGFCGWGVGVCVWGCVCVCVCLRGGYGWGGWGVLEGWECIVRRGKRNHTIISYLLH